MYAKSFNFLCLGPPGLAAKMNFNMMKVFYPSLPKVELLRVNLFC